MDNDDGKDDFVGCASALFVAFIIFLVGYGLGYFMR